MKKPLLLLALAALALRTLAHDAWVDPLGGPVYDILYGHKTPEAYPAAKVTSVRVLDARQQPLRFARVAGPRGLRIRPTGVPALFALEFDNGYWVKINGQSVNEPLSRRPEGTDPVHPLKFSKTILSWPAWALRPLGQRLELVPLAAAPRPGADLPLQLLLDGRPLAGQMVENNSDEQGPRTDAQGRVTVRVRPGLNRFATDHNIQQTTDPDAPRLSLTAALVFVAK